MKNCLTLALLVLIMAGCAASQKVSKKVDKQQKAAEMALQIDSLMKSQRFGVVVNGAYPQGWGMVPLNYDYGIQVHGNELQSNLPYYGRAFQLTYGGDKGLMFKGEVKRCEYVHLRNKQWTVKMWASDDEDNYVYTLVVYPNGRIDLTVDAGHRSRIRYTGILTKGTTK